MTMTSIAKNTLGFVLFVHLSFSVNAQQENNVILKAMQDELQRSMTRLEYDNHQKPFYISYSVYDTRVFSVYGSLGGVFGSRNLQTRDKGIRILVGDYEFNDESLDNNQSSEGSAYEIPMPVEDDYYGIRRSLWTSTDAVYKGAAQKFKKNQETLKEKTKPLSEIPHRTFAKVPSHRTIEEIPEYSVNKTKWEEYCRDLSSYFTEIPSLESSNVMITFTRTVRYFVDSEGIVAVTPETTAAFRCGGQVKTKDQTLKSASVVKYALTLDELPSFPELQKEVKSTVEKLKSASDTKSLEEEYVGPVLFTDEAVLAAFTQTVFTLNATNSLQGQEGYEGETASSIDNKVGKNYLDPAITIKATPTLKSFRGKALVGSFTMDGEGVKPPAELLLVEKGILKNLMNDRTLSKPGQTANGFNDGPGVLQISIEGGSSLIDLKQKLIAKAKADGLPFALMIKGTGAPNGQGTFYKIDTKTGAEELISPCRYKSIQPKELKRISGTTNQLMHAVQIGRSNLISAIIPEAVLVEEVTLNPYKTPSAKDDIEYVSSPLKTSLK
jgi:predicted Zn-dependent protease